MKSIVIDANVIIKWIFPERPNENNATQAIFLLQAIKQGNFKVYQPPHWIAEVAAVVVRLQSSITKDTINLLHALEFPIISEPEIYEIACQLSERCNHHLFDTLYHATALYGGYSFVTDDSKYYRKANKTGSIILLEDV